MRIKHPNLLAVVSLAAIMGLAGCQAPVKQACYVPSGTKLEVAMAQSKNTLSAPSCQYQFDDHVYSLLDIATKDPKVSNKAAFSGYFSWAADQGIIGKLQAKERFTRFFGAKFVTAMSSSNACSSTCPRKDAVYADMQRELGDKELGLLKVMNRPSEFSAASGFYGDLTEIIEATCTACSTTARR